MQTIYEYTMEIVDTVMKAAKLDSIHKHKILSEIHKLKSYKNFKHRVLSDKKVLRPRKPHAKLVFHTVPSIVQKIIILSCEKNEIDLELFCSNRRFADVLDAQRMVIYFLHKDVCYNSVKVGRWFMKDHSTILNACSVHEARIEREKLYRAVYANFQQEANKIISEV